MREIEFFFSKNVPMKMISTLQIDVRDVITKKKKQSEL